ncbi:MAG: hypothetical protein GXY44_16370 [Phycisphaerales bacterium]|nr:hypothetical protein [Phycisphaerales bacterium]
MYDKKVSRAEPGLIFMILDDSGSMSDALAGTSDAKFKWVERYVGIIWKELVLRSTEVKGDTVVVKPRYYTHTILYGSQANVWGNGIMDIQDTVEKYTQSGNSLGLGGRLGGTDAQNAFQQAYAILQQAAADPCFKNSFPPMVFHLTDGESQSDAQAIAQQVKQLATIDGQVLSVNAYIGTQTNLGYKGPEDFPGYVSTSDVGSNSDNLRLFEMSSEMPECMHHNLVDDGIFPQLRPGSRLFFDVRTKEMLKHVIQVVGSIGSRADRQAR